MKKIFLMIAAAVSLSCCAMPQAGMRPGGGLIRKKSAQQPPQLFVDETVTVVTEPSGAQIQINGSPAGNSPVSVQVRRLWRGDPGRMTLDTVKIEALPAGSGQCVQSGLYGQNNLKVPSPVSLKMTDCKDAYEYPEPAAAHLPSGSK